MPITKPDKPNDDFLLFALARGEGGLEELQIRVLLDRLDRFAIGQAESLFDQQRAEDDSTCTIGCPEFLHRSA